MSAPQTTAVQDNQNGRDVSKRFPKRLLFVVFGFLALTVTVHGVALVYAFTATTDLVREDYYEHGQAWDQELALMATGRAAGLVLEVSAGDGGTTRLSLQAVAGIEGREATVSIYRPEDARKDRKVTMVVAKQRPAGIGALWQGETEALGAGPWLLKAHVQGAPPMAVELRHMGAGATP